MAVSDWRPGRTGEGSHMEIQASVMCLEPDWGLRVRARVCPALLRHENPCPLRAHVVVGRGGQVEQ